MVLADYQPKPIDTSNVELGEIQSLVDLLTRNAHEVWAYLRLLEGWTYGPMRDDVRKLHPCLVPFDEMSDEDKAYDRAMLIEILKATIAAGFKIIRD